MNIVQGAILTLFSFTLVFISPMPFFLKAFFPSGKYRKTVTRPLRGNQHETELKSTGAAKLLHSSWKALNLACTRTLTRDGKAAGGS